LPVRRFPPPWSVEETDACFMVRDANGKGSRMRRKANYALEESRLK
jgi:hypothetical protein